MDSKKSGNNKNASLSGFRLLTSAVSFSEQQLVIDPILFYAVSFRGQRKLGPRPDWCPSQFNSTFQHFHKESHTDTLGYPQNDELKVKGIWVID